MDITDMNIKKFIEDDVIKYSLENCIRAIPKIEDGLKPSQRKILYTCLSKNVTTCVNLEQYAGIISDYTNYHHGGVSLCGAIKKMCSNFIGTNNINLLNGEGNFGTRESNGENAAAARYLHFKLNNITRYIFKKEDDCILVHNIDNNRQIEPITYYPIIPMCLVNGTSGIGSGYSTNILNYNPNDLIIYLKNKLNDTNNIQLIPWYKNFKGKIKQQNKTIINGVFNIKDHKSVSFIKPNKNDTVIEISELPIGISTNKYVTSILNPLIKNEIIIKKFDYSDEDEIKIILNMGNRFNDTILKLQKNITETYVLYHDNQFKSYKNIYEIIDDYYDIRLQKYTERISKNIEIIQIDLKLLYNKQKFINKVLNDKNFFFNNTKKEIIKLLENDNYYNNNGDYAYLYNMPAIKLTIDEIESLQKQINKLEYDLNTLKKKTNIQLWLEELNELQHILK